MKRIEIRAAAGWPPSPLPSPPKTTWGERVTDWAGAKTLTLFGPEGLREWHPYEEKQGHLALRPETGKILDLTEDAAREAVLKWMKR